MAFPQLQPLAVVQNQDFQVVFGLASFVDTQGPGSAIPMTVTGGSVGCRITAGEPTSENPVPATLLALTSTPTAGGSSIVAGGPTTLQGQSWQSGTLTLTLSSADILAFLPIGDEWYYDIFTTIGTKQYWVYGPFAVQGTAAR